MGNRPANDVGKCSATKAQACGGARAIEDALDEVLTVARERGKHRRRMVYLVKCPPDLRAMPEQVCEIKNHVCDQQRHESIDHLPAERDRQCRTRTEEILCPEYRPPLDGRCNQRDPEHKPQGHQRPIQKVKTDIDPRRRVGIDLPRYQVLAQSHHPLATVGTPGAPAGTDDKQRERDGQRQREQGPVQRPGSRTRQHGLVQCVGGAGRDVGKRSENPIAEVRETGVEGHMPRRFLKWASAAQQSVQHRKLTGCSWLGVRRSGAHRDKRRGDDRRRWRLEITGKSTPSLSSSYHRAQQNPCDQDRHKDRPRNDVFSLGN